MKEFKSVRDENIALLRGLAILAVVCVHSGNRELHGGIIDVLGAIYAYFSRIGVPLFLIMAGYLYGNKKPFIQIAKSKIISIGIPWMASGTFIWIYYLLRKGISYTGTLPHYLITGYLWFLPVLMACFVIGFFIRGRKSSVAFFLVCVAVSSLVKNEWVLLPDWGGDLLTHVGTQAVFFAFGMFLRAFDALTPFLNYAISRKPLLLVGAVLLAVSSLFFCAELYLFYIFAAVFAWSLLFILCMNQFPKLKPVFLWVGDYSFMIYLFHMPIAGMVVNLFERGEVLPYLFFLKMPLIVFAIFSAVKAFGWVFGRWKYTPFIACYLFGVRVVGKVNGN